MSVHNGHRGRLRARFLKHGLNGLEEHTILELLLCYAIPRRDTNELAHALINKFGSFAAVIDAPVEELMQVKGMGENSAVLLKMILPMSGYYLENKSAPGEIIDSTQKAGKYIMPKFFGKRNEEVYMIALDDKRKVIRCVQIGDGGIVNAVQIAVKRVVTEVVNANATAVILAHNHPGGVALPSLSDKRISSEIYNTLKMINVQMLDHIIVSDDDFVSMADSGFFESLG